MARVTVEDCVDKIPNRFDLVMLASQRARNLSAGEELTLDRDNDKNPVLALREITVETVTYEELKESAIESHQRQIEVDEPDVSPLQVQGPNSIKLMTKVFGDWINDLSFYRFKEINHEGIPMVIARMGYSKELCYELFLQDHSKGDELWEILWQAGQEFNISPGSPNIILRLEGGILSYLADIDRTNNPYEVGLDRMVDLDQDDDFIGKDALREICLKGPEKKLMGAEIHGDPLTIFNAEHWPVFINNKNVGSMNAMVYSPRLNKNICYTILDIEHAKSGQEITISAPDCELKAVTVDLPWLERA